MKSSREELPGCLSNSEEPQGREQKDQGRKRRGDVRGNGADCAGFIKQQNEERLIYRWTDNGESRNIGYCTGRL